jgi:hypothetical protein
MHVERLQDHCLHSEDSISIWIHASFLLCLPLIILQSTIMSVNENKIAIQHVEDFDKVQDVQHDFEDVPESLRELSPQELAKIGKWTTLKLDCIVMPALTILYIL